jgi:hypothetical protein
MSRPAFPCGYTHPTMARNLLLLGCGLGSSSVHERVGVATNEQQRPEDNFENQGPFIISHCSNVRHSVDRSSSLASGAGHAVSQCASIQRSLKESICRTADGSHSGIEAVRNGLQLLSWKSWARKRSDACRRPRIYAISVGWGDLLVYHDWSCRQRDAILEHTLRAATMADCRLSEIAQEFSEYAED